MYMHVYQIVPFRHILSGLYVIYTSYSCLYTYKLIQYSSLAWYFMLQFGVNGVFGLLIGDNNIQMDQNQMMQMQVSV